MRALGSFDKIFLHRLPVDGRKQINGLAVVVQKNMRRNPLEGGLFVFINKGRDTLRLLYWDRSGFAMWVKRLEKEKFRWPLKTHDDVITLTERQLSWLLDGLDIVRIQPHEELLFPATN